jgi:hypothetical protein
MCCVITWRAAARVWQGCHARMEVCKIAGMIYQPYRQKPRLKIHLRPAADGEIVIGSSRPLGQHCHQMPLGQSEGSQIRDDTRGDSPT